MMAPMDTKLSAVRTAFEAGDVRTAIALAAKFPRLGDQRAAILDAHTAFVNPRWTSAMKRDAAADIAAGARALAERYGFRVPATASGPDIPDQRAVRCA